MAEWDFSKPIRGGPTERGFDTYFGVDLPNLSAVHVHRKRSRRRASDGAIRAPIRNARFDGEGCSPAPRWRRAGNSTRFFPRSPAEPFAIFTSKPKPDKPFFLYFAMTSPHEPIAPSKQFAGKSGIAPIADFLMETDWSAGEVIQGDRRRRHWRQHDRDLRRRQRPWPHQRLGQAHQGRHPTKRALPRRERRYLGGRASRAVRCSLARARRGRAVRAISCCASTICLPRAPRCWELPRSSCRTTRPRTVSVFCRPHLALRPKAICGTNLVSHSVHGEFAYRENGWKIVFKMPGDKLADSRGKPTVVELYNLDDDIAEKNDVAKQHPEIVQQLTIELQRRVDAGRSTPGIPQHNDTKVRFDVMPTERSGASASPGPLSPTPPSPKHLRPRFRRPGPPLSSPLSMTGTRGGPPGGGGDVLVSLSPLHLIARPDRWLHDPPAGRSAESYHLDENLYRTLSLVTYH